MVFSENQSRLADEILLYDNLKYAEIKSVAPGVEKPILKRLPDLNEFCVDRLIKDIERFLDILKNLPNIGGLINPVCLFSMFSCRDSSIDCQSSVPFNR